MRFSWCEPERVERSGLEAEALPRPGRDLDRLRAGAAAIHLPSCRSDLPLGDLHDAHAHDRCQGVRAPSQAHEILAFDAACSCATSPGRPCFLSVIADLDRLGRAIDGTDFLPSPRPRLDPPK
mgnify:CR=1 FL=1